MQIKIKDVFNVVDKGLLAINIVLAMLLLVCYLSPLMAPNASSLVALIGLGYPLLLGFNAFFLVYWPLRSRLFWLISFCCILIGIRFLTHYFGFNMPAAAVNHPGALKVMSYNVHNFMGTDTTHVTYVENQIIDVINGEHPDIVSIQEFSVNVKNNKAIYADLKSGLHSNQYCFIPYECARWDTVGLAIFSKFPIINHGVITTQLYETENQVMFVDVKQNNKIIRVYNLHLQPIHFSTTEHQYIRKLEHRAKINRGLMKTITQKLEIAFVKRACVIEALKKSMASCPYPYVLAGDFNDTPISYVVTHISEGLQNAFIEKGSGLGTTYYGDFPHFQIDYILASKHFNVVNYQTIKKKISDHYAITSQLELK